MILAKVCGLKAGNKEKEWSALVLMWIFQFHISKFVNLNKHYAVQGHTVHALKNIDLDIPTGKVFGIIGKSGAGKSSLLRTLNGLERISEGHIHIHQQDLAALKPC